MRRATGLRAGLMIGLGVLCGCGQEKQLPSDIQLPNAKEGPAAAVVPAKSQPEAVELAQRCVKAVTDGHPERLERAKAHSQSAKGTWRWESNVLSPATRHIQAVWPDRLRVTYEFLTGDIKQSQIGLRRPDVWAINVRDAGPIEFNPPNRQEYGEIVAVDVIGQHWLPMLVPLVDPETVVFGAKKETLANQPAEVLQVAVKGCPVYTLWVADKTCVPQLITYTHVEANTTLQKQLTMSGHKPFGGILLPTEIEFSRNAKPVEQWTVTAWDFVYKIDDTTFDRPAEKR